MYLKLSIFRSNLFRAYLKLMYVLFEYYFNFNGRKKCLRTRKKINVF